MLQIVKLKEKFNINEPCVMLLGGFDGMHKGHRKLVETGKSFGLPICAMTIGGGKSSKNLFTFKEREEIFKSLDIDCVFEMPFLEIKDLTPDEFISLIKRNFKVKAFVCGTDFRFGREAQGDAEYLKSLKDYKIEVKELLFENGEKVSCKFIKELLKDGKIQKANDFLVEPFFIMGEVVKDRQIGRTINFPTANILYPKEKFPIKMAVYESFVDYNGKRYKGITNFGYRPTFNDKKVVTETYLDGFNENLYGKTIKVNFVRFLRDIKNFGSAKALKAQLEYDIGRVKNGD